MAATHLVWFRDDLRVADNHALSAACATREARVLAVFIATPQQWQMHNMAPRQADFLLRHLQQLQQSLAKLRIPLHYFQTAHFADVPERLAELCAAEQITTLFFNRQYPLNEQRRDQAVIRRLSPHLSCQQFDDSLLLAPGSVTNRQGKMFRVFTPFRQAALAQLRVAMPTPLPSPQPRDANRPVLASLTPFDYPTQPSSYFPAGEEAAWQRLFYFCQHRLADYQRLRDFPAVAGTSQLSPYLTVGIISPRQCLSVLQTVCNEGLTASSGDAFSWLNELLWREFYRHLIVAFPQLCKHQAFIPWTDHVWWPQSTQWLEAWQQGKTGYPLVDAAMRQLNSTGWMHNRLRMVTASFLCKHLRLDWRLGERYFMSQLIDGELAANNGGWQWAASSGCDAVPYFRLFNPTHQSQRFDPDGAFIRHWLPELRQLPNCQIHAPSAGKNVPPLHYPPPVVDHRVARQTTLAAFKAARQIRSSSGAPR